MFSSLRRTTFLATCIKPTQSLRTKPTQSLLYSRPRFQYSKMSTSAPPPEGSSTTHFPTAPNTPGEQYEARQTKDSEDYKPDPSKSFPLSPARQALVDDIIALYSCEPTVERVKRYTPDCVYDDQFVYANDRYKMAVSPPTLKSSQAPKSK